MPLYKSLIFLIFLFLKCLLASRLTLFRLYTFLWLGSCTHCNFSCFLSSKKCRHSSSNQGLCCFNSCRPRLCLAEVLMFSLIFSHAPFPPNLSYVPTKSNPYLVNSMVTVLSDPDLYRLPMFHVLNLKSLFHCLHHTKGSVHAWRIFEWFATWYFFVIRSVLAPLSTPQSGGNSLLAVHDYLLNMFAAAMHIGGHSSIYTVRMHHFMVTGTYLSWVIVAVCCQ